MMQQLLETYGYPLLFVGTFLEGETPLLAASFLAHRGYLSFPMVVLVAFAGTFCADQLFFQLGRSRGGDLLSKRPGWQAKADRIGELLQRHGVALVIGFRFLYGVRTVAPFVIGMSGFGRARFVALNAIGAALWSLVLASAGFSLGSLLGALLGDLRRYEGGIVLSILLASAIAWLVYLRRRAREARTRAKR